MPNSLVDARRRGRIRRLCQAICDAETSTNEAELMGKLVDQIVKKECASLRREVSYWRGLTPVSLGGERV